MITVLSILFGVLCMPCKYSRAFVPTSPNSIRNFAIRNAISKSALLACNENDANTKFSGYAFDRRCALNALFSTATLLTSNLANADDTFESIAERASRISKSVEEEEEKTKPIVTTATEQPNDSRTVYDFSLPVAGEQISFSDLIHQEFIPQEEGIPDQVKVKAILVVNIKQDDPIARKNIAEFISLASK